MAHLISLGFQVEPVMWIWLDNQRNIFGDSDSIAFQPCSFYRVIGDKPYFSQVQKMQDISTHTIIAFVVIEPEFNICFDGITALFLEFVCLDFIEQSNSPPFLVH